MKSHRETTAILIGFALLLVACNLGVSDNAPPTLAPLPTRTPPPTLGYVAVGPVRAPGIGATAAAPAESDISAILEQVESDRLMSHIRTLQDFRTRHVNSSQVSSNEGIGAARAYLNGQFETYRQASNGGLYTFDLPFESVTADAERRLQHNIVAVIQGTELGAGTLIVGAHYDSVGRPLDSGTVDAPGANDNGSGVAAVLELARIMSKSRYKATIMFALFSAEEVGRQGSRAFASWISENQTDVIGMINVDTIGNVHDFYGLVNDRELRVFSAGPNETSISRKLARAANFIGFNFGLDLDLTVQDAIDRENRYGDHFSFSELDYPAIRLINAFEEKRNGDPTDTIEYIEAGYLRSATQALLAILTSLADGPRPPDNIVLRVNAGEPELVWAPVSEATGYIIALRPPGSLYYERQIAHSGSTSMTWSGFEDYASIAIAATDGSGITGPLSREITPR